MIDFKMKEKQELSASTVAFISLTVVLRVKLAGAARCSSLESGSGCRGMPDTNFKLHTNLIFNSNNHLAKLLLNTTHLPYIHPHQLSTLTI
jgi:hypothetical protein